MPLTVPPLAIFGAQSTGAFKFVKDLVLEVPRLPLTCREALFSASSPVAGAALSKLHVLDAHFFREIQNHSRVRRRRESPHADEVSYTKSKHGVQPGGPFFAAAPGKSALNPHEHWYLASGKRFRPETEVPRCEVLGRLIPHDSHRDIHTLRCTHYVELFQLLLNPTL